MTWDVFGIFATRADRVWRHPYMLLGMQNSQSSFRHFQTWVFNNEDDKLNGQTWSVALRPQKPSGLLGTGAQDGHLDNVHIL